jgi:hypothetical protein
MADPTLTSASITFHTNDDDKDDDTIVYVSVQKGTTVAADITDRFGHFNNNSDSGPFDLLMKNSLTREQLRTGNVTLAITPNGNDTWRFNFFLDLRFSDGSHLIAKANGLQMTEIFQQLWFGLE